MFDALADWWNAPEPSPPLTVSEVLPHVARGVVRLSPVVLLVGLWRYVAAGVPELLFVLAGGVALTAALVAGVLGGLRRQYLAALAFVVVIAVLGQTGPFVVGLGAAEGVVATGSLALVVLSAISAVVGYAEVRRLQMPAPSR